MSRLDYLRFLYRTGRLADDTESDGETFREVVEGLDALDDIRPAPPATAPVSRLFCYHCRMWYDGPLEHKGEPCPNCIAEFEDNERRQIERNRRRGIPLCIICGAESPTTVCEQCEHRPMSQRTRPFDYGRLERQTACGMTPEGLKRLYADVTDNTHIDRVFCENCGAALPALFRIDGSPMGVEDCVVCEGLRGPKGDYCRRCGHGKVRKSLLRSGLLFLEKECPYCNG